MGRVRDRDQLREHLLVTRISGRVATPREANLRSYRMFAAGDPRALLGLLPSREWNATEVLSLMAERCGVSPDPGRMRGEDRIDVERTLDGLDELARILAAAVSRRTPVLFGTGHPQTLLGFHSALAEAMAAAGCPVLMPVRGTVVPLPTSFGPRPHVLDRIGAVAVVRPRAIGHLHSGEAPPGRAAAEEPSTAQPHPTGAGPVVPGMSRQAPPAHTHSPLPVRAALAALAESGGPFPEMVVGDHGWVCGAGQLGIQTVGLADSNDPALFVGEKEGRVGLAVPLDDAVRPAYYLPVVRYVLDQAFLLR